jgi:ATP-binding cassette, subfamily C (CFTR/MRP), member 1
MQAIARALYSKREFLILDDVFSGLDATTEDQIFNNLFGQQGLIRTGNLTAIIASSDGLFCPSLI